MMNLKHLVKDYLLYFVGHSSARIVTFLVLPLFTKALTLEEYGVFELISSASIVLAPLISLQLSEAAIRINLGNEERNKKKNTLSVVTNLIVVTCIITNLLFFVISDIWEIQNQIEIFLYFNSFYFSNYLMRIARAEGDRKLYSLSNLIYSSSLLVSTIFVFLSSNLTLSNILILYSFANFTAIIVLLIKLDNKKLFKIEKMELAFILSLVSYSIPLLFESINFWIMNLSDRFIIAKFMTLEYVGIYGVAYKLSIAIYFLQTIFNLIWQEESFKLAGEKSVPQRNAYIFNNLSKLLFSAFIILLPLFYFYIDFFVDGKFSSAMDYLPIILGGIVFSALSSFIGIKYQVSKRTKGSFYTSLFGAILNLTLSIILIQFIGLYGAALSTLISFLVLFLIRLRDSNYYIDISKIDKLNFLLGIASCLIYGIIFSLDISNYIYIILAFSVVLFFFFNREFLKRIWEIKR